MNIDKKNLNIKYFINIGLKLQNFLTIAMHSKMQWFLLCLLVIATSLAYSQQVNIENADTDTTTFESTDSLVTTQKDTLQTIEKTYKNLYVKSNLSGEFTIVNPHLVKKLKELDLWDDVMINDLKYFEGSLSEISRIPEDIKKLFSTAFEVEPRYIVESASRRQKWIDQAQSLNLYIGNADGKKLDITYRMAWYSGLKTTYYLRSIAATSTEKSTVQQGKLNAVSSDANQNSTEELGAPAPVPDACSLDDPDCEACQ